MNKETQDEKLIRWSEYMLGIKEDKVLKSRGIKCRGTNES